MLTETHISLHEKAIKLLKEAQFALDRADYWQEERDKGTSQLAATMKPFYNENIQKEINTRYKCISEYAEVLRELAAAGIYGTQQAIINDETTQP